MSLDSITANGIIDFLATAKIAGIVGNYSTDLVKSGNTKILELGRKIWRKIRDRLEIDPDANK